MPRKKESHLHRYERIRLGRGGNYIVFRCVKVGCTHYVRKEFARGRIAECNRCGEPMILDAPSMQLQKPHCRNCVQRKEDLTKIAEKLFG